MLVIGSHTFPIKVHNLGDALTVARITGEPMWALVLGTKKVYRVYPGGRIENHGDLPPLSVFDEFGEDGELCPHCRQPMLRNTITPLLCEICGSRPANFMQHLKWVCLQCARPAAPAKVDGHGERRTMP